MSDIVIIIAVVVGTFFMVVGSLGVLTLPDFFYRIHPPAKASTFGVLFLLIAIAVEDPRAETITKAILAFLFLAITAPVAIHLLTRTAYRMRIPNADEPKPDDYREYVNRHPDEPGPSIRPVEADPD